MFYSVPPCKCLNITSNEAAAASLHIHVTLLHKFTNFTKILYPYRNYRQQNDDMKKFHTENSQI